MKRKSIIIVSIILIAIIAVIFFYVFRHKESSFAWKTVPVRKGNITILVKSTGTLSADTTVEVGTQVTGTIWKLLADYNSVVKKGQIIAVLDTTFLSASRVTALAQLQSAKANLKQAKWNYDRNKILLKEKVIPQSDYETTQTNLAVARASEVSAEANLNHAKINLQYAVIKAPVTGTVISRDVELGQTVVASFNSVTLFTIANDLTKMQVKAYVDEADIGQIKQEQQVTFTVDAYPNDVFKGVVSQVRLNPVTSENVVNYIVIIDVKNKELKLMPGMTANISIRIREHEDILKVPASALSFTPPTTYFKNNPPDKMIRQNTRSKLGHKRPVSFENPPALAKQNFGFIWIARGKNIHPVRVKLGLSDGYYTEVSGNIKEGDLVVTGSTGSSTTQTSESRRSRGPNSPFMPPRPHR